MINTGLGPHGEKPFPADKLAIGDEDAALVRSGRFAVAIVLHTAASDWSRELLAGAAATLHAYGATVFEVVDCNFDPEKQNGALSRLAQTPVHAVISLPVASTGVRDAHLAVSRAGKKLVLLDNAPPGLRPGVDYVSVCSADNFGLGMMAAELSSPYVPNEGVLGILTYAAEFFVTGEREIGFRKWMHLHRPDVTLVRSRFPKIEKAGEAYRRLLADNDDLDCVFVAWDVPAMHALKAIREGARSLPMTTVDLGAAARAELKRGGPLKALAAQRPYDQGTSAAKAALLGAIGRAPPAWISVSGLKVTQENLGEACGELWRVPSP